MNISTKRLMLAATTGVVVCVLLSTICPRVTAPIRKALDPAGLTPWQCVGGCGTGGSGSRSTGIKWIGQETYGAKLKLEYLPKINTGKTFAFASVEPRLTYIPKSNIEIGLSIPLGLAGAEVQSDSSVSPQTFLNGGSGDMSADVSQRIGDHGQYAWQLSLTMPTGRYDESRGPERSKRLLPQLLQMGRGVYSLDLRFSYTRDFDRAMALFEGSFYYPFMGSVNGKNAFIESDYKAYQGMLVNRKRFYYRFKPYGENDRGGYFPPSIDVNAVYAYRGVPKMVQSFQCSFSAPLGVRWIPSYNPFYYDPIPDPDNRAWDVVLAYGMEFSREKFPIFLAFGLPIHDARGTATADKYDPTPFAKWSAPAWSEIGQEWIFALGFRAILF